MPLKPLQPQQQKESEKDTPLIILLDDEQAWSRYSCYSPFPDTTLRFVCHGWAGNMLRSIISGRFYGNRVSLRSVGPLCHLSAATPTTAAHPATCIAGVAAIRGRMCVLAFPTENLALQRLSLRSHRMVDGSHQLSEKL